MRLLFEYLTDSSVGAFQLEFVENDDPLCSGVAYSEMENSRTTFYFEYEAVPQENVKKIVPTMEKTLKQQVKNFDISRMKDIIQKNFQEELSSMENTPHNSIAYAVIGDYLYGSDDNAVVKTMFHLESI
jgi:Zn-dependent M16 (insulinase) family peptidase